MRGSLVLLVASRYFRTRRREKGYGSSLLSVAGIAVGVMTLTVVLAVMNGFQLGFIESIVEISSYHLQLSPGKSPPGREAGADELERAILGVPGVRAVVPFVERQALLETPYARPRACAVRAVPVDLFRRDPSQQARIEMLQGSFDLAGGGTVVIGAELAASTGARVGDLLDLVTLARGQGLSARRSSFEVAGIFRTGYYDYDAGLAFVSLEAAQAIFGSGEPLPRTLGVKVGDRFGEAGPARAIARLPAAAGWTVESWRSYNRSFFDALLVEKLMMLLLVGLIFVVVGFNVYHSLRRTIFERMEDIAVLKALGAPPLAVQAIFVLEGLLIGLAGAASGLLLGLLLSVNINAVFDAVEALVNGLTRIAGALLSPFLPVESGGFAIFSPMYFYLTDVPSRVLPREAFLVVFLALAACGGAAFAASRAVSRYRPAEVLRNE